MSKLSDFSISNSPELTFRDADKPCSHSLIERSVEVVFWNSLNWQALALEHIHAKGYPNASISRCANGKPFFLHAEPWHFNVSTSQGQTLAAFAQFPIGVDLEPIARKVSHSKIAQRWFFANELQWLLSAEQSQHPLRFLALWTAKEAAVKLDGCGIYHGGLCNCQIHLPPNAPPYASLHGNTIHLQHILLNRTFLACFAAYAQFSLIFDHFINYESFPLLRA